MPHPELPPLPPYIYGFEAGPNEKVWTESAVHELRQEVRRMALEEAATLCEKMASVRLGNLGATGLHLLGASIVNDRMRLTEGMHECSSAIRALIDKQRTE